MLDRMENQRNYRTSDFICFEIIFRRITSISDQDSQLHTIFDEISHFIIIIIYDEAFYELINDDGIELKKPKLVEI